MLARCHKVWAKHGNGKNQRIADAPPKAIDLGRVRWTFFTVVLTFCLFASNLVRAQEACNAGACAFIGPRLASFDSSRGALSNALFSALLGSDAQLSVLDWNALAGSNVSLARYVGALGLELNLSTPSEALNTRATLLQFIRAATSVAQADGNTALVSALNTLSVPVAGLSTPLKLGDLLHVSFPPGSLTDTQLNVLSLVTGLVQLYNYENVVTTRQPVTLSAASLGLNGVLNGVELFAQVVEPPIYTCGGVGTEFYSAAIRIKLNLDLVDITPNSASLVSALSALGSVQATVRIGQLELYADVARAQGVITALSAVERALTLTATPGVASLYLGTVSDTLFYNRARKIGPTDVSFGTIGNLRLRVAVPVVGTVLADVTVTIQARAAAEGEAPFNSTFGFTSPYPKSQTASSSTTFVTNLLNSLVSNLQLQLGGSLGPLLNPLVNSTILPVLSVIVRGTLSPILAPILSTLIDPLLSTLGIRIGEVDVTVFGVTLLCRVTGTLYHDRNRNSARDTGETWGENGQDGSGAVVNVINDAAVIASSPVAADSGTFSMNDVPAGRYSLIVTGSSSATVPSPPTAFLFINPPLGLRTLELGSSGVGADGQDFGLALIDPGSLTLVETVRNVTALENNFVMTNSAEPDDTLEYQLVYSNLSGQSVSNVSLSLVIPPDTTLLENSYGAAGELELTCPDGSLMQVDTGPATLLTVGVSAQCGFGTLVPSESGVIRFRVRVR